MSMVRMYDPQGRPLDVPQGEVQQALDAKASYAPPREVRDFTAADRKGLTNAQTNADIGRYAVREFLPSAVSMGASLVAPEVGAATRIAPWLLRMGAAGLGGTAGALGAQGLTGQRLDPMAAASRGVGEMTAQGVGEVMVPGMQAAAEGIYRNVLRPGKTLAQSATETASRIAGQPVAPDMADMSRQALSERVPLGRGIRGTGGERMASLQAPSNNDLTDALAAAGNAGHSHAIRDLADGVTALKNEVRGETRSAEKIARIDAMWREMIDKYRQAPRKGSKIGKDVRLTPQQLQDEVRTWQHQATSYWKGVEGGRPDELAALNARFDAALASAGRRRLNEIPVFGPIIEKANTRLSSLHPLADAISNRELSMAGGSSGSSFPWYMHAGGPATGALAGSMAHGTEGAAGGALLGLAVDRLISNPVTGSRIALGLTNPIVQGVARQSPRAAFALLNLLNAPQQPDALNPNGGTR